MRQRIIVAIVIALATTACQKKASGQTVAVVNGEEVTASQLNSALAGMGNLPGGDTKEARQAVLQKLVDQTLLVQAAKSDGIDKSPEYLNQLQTATDDLLIKMLVSKRLNTAEIPSAEEISRFEASRPEMFAGRENWTLTQIVYPLPKNSAVTAKIAAAKTLDEIAQVLKSNGIQFTRGTKKLDTIVFPHDLYAQIAHLQPGEPFIAPGPDKAVANVISAREPNPTPADQARTLALNAMRNDQVNKILGDRLKGLRTTAKIEYQAGFAPSPK